MKHNHGRSFSLSLLFSLVCPYHSNYHERALRIERLLHWLPGSPKTIRVEISSRSFVTPSKYSPLGLFYTWRAFWSSVQHSCSVPKWGAI